MAASGVADFVGCDHATEEEADGVVGEVGLVGDGGGCKGLQALAEEVEDGLTLDGVVVDFWLDE